MKKMIFGFAFIAVLLFSVSAQNNPNRDSSEFIITGIPERYNGRYVFILAFGSTSGEIHGYNGGTFPTAVQLVEIIDGRAIIPLHSGNMAYVGNDTMTVRVYIYSERIINDPEVGMFDFFDGNVPATFITLYVFFGVEFRNGRAVKNSSEWSQPG